MFIKQVFYGVLRYNEFLKIFIDSFFTAKQTAVDRKDQTLYNIFVYLTTFRFDELPIDDFQSFIIVRDKLY